jgi:hypothetical protein
MRRIKPTCNAKTRRGTPCGCKPEPGKKRCRLHGGLSSGPKTLPGKAQSRANLQRALEAINADTPEAAEARRRRAERASATRARNRAIRKREADWRTWCARHGYDPITMRRLSRSP